MYYVSLDKLSVGYDKKPLIKDINIGIEKGEIVTLIGPNGSGKSTILKSLTRQLALVAGNVLYENKSLKDISHPDLAKIMSVVLTDRIKPELLTCYDIVSSGRYPHTGKLGNLSEEDEKKVDDALESVNAKDLGKRDFNSLSDGQKQRVLIARAICQEPDIMILDEPTSFLDIKYKLELLDILRKMAKRNRITVILSLHEIDFAREISDKVMCVKGDRIYGYGTPDEIFTDEMITNLYEIKPGQYNAKTGSINFYPEEEKDDDVVFNNLNSKSIVAEDYFYDSTLADADERRNSVAECRRRWDLVAKPLGSLGKFEHIFAQIAGITKNAEIRLDKKALVIMCADNGVVAEGVSQTGQEITALVAGNFLKGEASSAIMCKYTGTDIMPVDIGMVSDVEGIENKKIAYGTKNFATSPAMTIDEAKAAVNVGIEKIKELKEKGYNIVATGEMGIGNTTTSSAVASVLLDISPEIVTGVGSGLTKQGLNKKIETIKNAIALHKPDKDDAIDVLSKVGGFDIAGISGMFLGGMKYDMPVVIDGFISAVAALCAVRIDPACRDFIIPSHVSNEPGARIVVEALGIDPAITAGLCLGEGTGALMLFPMLDMTGEIYRGMSSFNDIGMDNYERYSDE